MRILFKGFLTLALAAPAPALAKDHFITYSGRITEPTGKPLSGKTDFKVRFYDAGTGGAMRGPVLEIPGVDVLHGVFQLALEFSSAEAEVLFGNDTPLFIELEDLTRGKKFARQRFNEIPYAIQASSAKALNSIPIETGTPADGEILKYSSVSGTWKFEADAGSAGSGEINTGASLGGDAAVFKVKDLTELQFRGVSAGNGISVSEQANDIVISAAVTSVAGKTGALTLNADDVAETASKKWMTPAEQTKLAGITAGANMLKSTYDANDNGKVDQAETADLATNATNATNAADSALLGGNNAAFYRNASNINAGQIGDAYIPAAIARDSELPTPASIASGFADDAVSGNKIHGGTISNFASTGIDDNADAIALTIDSSERVGIGTTIPSAKLEIGGVAGTDGIKFPDGTLATSALPKFHGVKVYLNSPQTTTGGALASVRFDGEAFDTDNFHSTTTNPENVTIPAGLSGYYLLMSCVAWETLPNYVRLVIIRKNGAQIAETRFNPGGTGQATQCVSTTTYASAGDVIDVPVRQTSPDDLALVNSELTQLTVTFLGK